MQFDMFVSGNDHLGLRRRLEDQVIRLTCMCGHPDGAGMVVNMPDFREQIEDGTFGDLMFCCPGCKKALSGQQVADLIRWSFSECDRDSRDLARRN